MITKVGTQVKFADAMRELLALEYDAIEAYDVALSRLGSRVYRHKLLDFLEDHKRYIQELSEILDAHDQDLPELPSKGQWLAKGKVALASVVGDGAILSAIQSNEEDVIKAYERAVCSTDMWDDARYVLVNGLKDINIHEKWLSLN